MIEVMVIRQASGGWRIVCSHCSDIGWRECSLDAHTVADRHVAGHRPRVAVA